MKGFTGYRAIGLKSRVIANGPGDLGLIQGRFILKTQKIVLDAALLSTPQYKVSIKSKLEKSREWSSALPLHLSVVAIEKGAFGSPSTKVAKFTFTFERFCFVHINWYLAIT